MSNSIKTLLISIFVCLLGGLGYLFYQLKISEKNLNKTEAQKLGVELKTLAINGVVKKGSDISPQKDYCPNELYIVSEGLTYQLRTPDNSKTVGNIAYYSFRDSNVKVEAKTNNLSGLCDTELKDCSCDPYVLVDNIQKTDSLTPDFTKFDGEITCLEIKQGYPKDDICPYGLRATDGKVYYLAKLNPDDTFAVGQKVAVLGEVIPTYISKYNAESAIEVVKIE